MTAPYTRSTKIEFTTKEGGVLSFPARVEGGRVTRTLGLGGDSLAVLVRATDWPVPNGPVTGGGVDFRKPCTLKFKATFAGGTPAPVEQVLEHYFIRQIDPEMVVATAANAPAGVGIGAMLVRIRFETLPGFYRGDGRGGMLRDKVRNKVLSSGEVDTGHADYKLNSELVDLCLSALGLAYEVSPISLDETPPPGPLDWGNANALHELEAVLDYCGHAVAIPNHGDQCKIIQLPKRADVIDLDDDIEEALAAPLTVATAPSLRGEVIVVHSAGTRTTVLTWRNLDAMEWVWFDETGFAWRNAAQTEALPGGGGIKPDSISAFRAGPSSTDDVARAQYNRIFRALRLTGDDANLRLVQSWEPATFNDGTRLGSTAAYVKGRVSAPVGSEQFVGLPLDLASPRASLGPADVHSEAGVFILPTDFIFARPAADFSAGQQGTYGRGDMAALSGDNLIIYFAHEADFTEDYGGYRKNYFVAAWRVSLDAGNLVYNELTGDDLILALDDPTTVKVPAPQLRRLMKFDPGDIVPVDVNFDALKTRALEIVKRRSTLGLAKGGVAECVGWLDKVPGCCGGACSSVVWDIDNYRTFFTLNDHETPDGELDQRAADAKRSFAAGVNRFALPGSAVDLADVRSAVLAGQPMTGSAGAAGASGNRAGNHAETAGATRGHTTKPATEKAVTFAAPPLPPGMFPARITGSSSLPGNRWSYTWEQVRLITSGAEAGTAVAVGNPFTSVTHGLAYNLCESHNDGSGIEGSGINVANLPAGWGVQPITSGAIVLIEFCARDASGGAGRAVFFARENAVDGACPSSGSAGGGGGETGLRPATEGVLAALDMVLTDAAGNVLLDANGEALLDGDSVGLSLSDLTALTSLLLDGSGPGAAFLNDAHGHLLIGDAGSLVAVGSEQLIDRVLTGADGQPLTDDAGRLLASA